MIEFTVPIRPRYGEVDRMGFVHHPHVLVYFELGRTEYMRSCGLSYAAVEAGGHRLVVAGATVGYLAPSRYDEMLSLAVALDSLGRASVGFRYTLTGPAGDTRAVGTTRLGCLDRSGRPCRLPSELRSALERGRSGGRTVSNTP